MCSFFQNVWMYTIWTSRFVYILTLNFFACYPFTDLSAPDEVADSWGVTVKQTPGKTRQLSVVKYDPAGPAPTYKPTVAEYRATSILPKPQP